jgi:hypothetical protein
MLPHIEEAGVQVKKILTGDRQVIDSLPQDSPASPPQPLPIKGKG